MRCDDGGMANGEVKLDFMLDVPAHYFKSSFARAMISDSRSPRSLDTAIAAEIWAREGEGAARAKGLCAVKGSPRTRGTPQVATICKLNQKASRASSRSEVTLSPFSGPASLPPTDMHIQRPKKERAPTPPSVDVEERNGRPSLGSAGAASPGPVSVTSVASSASGASAQGGLAAARETALLLDTARLQSQVDTLAWQLRQTEASRQTYRRLMEQVVQFLERAHKSLDAMRDKPVQGRRAAAINGSGRASPASEQACRVPRSRSVHTVAAAPSRQASPPRPDAPSPLSGRAKSVAHMEDAAGTSSPIAPCGAYRDFTWRRARKQQLDPECVPPERLSEESFRLLRLVQSLLSVQEPDLAQRISSDTSSLNSSTLDHLPDRSYPNSVGQRSSTASSGLDIPDDKGSVLELSRSFNKKLGLADNPAPLSLPPCSPAPSNCSRFLSSADTMSVHSVHSTSSKAAHSFKNSPLTSGLEAGFAGRNNTSTPSPPLEKDMERSTSTPPKQQLSEDESGFSSMNSFQDVGVPLVTPPLPSSPPPNASFQEVGLPIVETPTIPAGKHRRWSSVPVGAQTHFPQHNQSFCLPQESLRVLWV